MKLGFNFGKRGTVGRVTPEEHAVVERMLLGELTPDEAAKRLGGKAHVREHHWRLGDEAQDGDLAAAPASGQAPAETPSDDPAARLVAEVARGVEAEQASAPKPEIPWRRAQLLAGAGIAVLALAAVLNGDTSRDHALTALLVALGALVFFSLLGIPLGLLPRRRPLVPPAAIGGAAVMLAWGLVLAATDNWDAYVPSVFYVGFVVSLVVAGAGAMRIAHRAEKTLDAIHRRPK